MTRQCGNVKARIAFQKKLISDLLEWTNGASKLYERGEQIIVKMKNVPLKYEYF